jgi:hypothetical protein
MMHINCKFQIAIFCTLTATFPLAGMAQAILTDPFSMTPVASHHYAGINSGQPYVGGFQVLSDDFRTYMQIDGAVRRLENMRNDAKSLTIKTLRDVGKLCLIGVAQRDDLHILRA